MNYLSNKKGFLGIDNKFNFKEKVVIVPFGLEKTVSYGHGTKNGPKEIIKASHQVELYDEELNCEPYKKIGIRTLKPFKIDKNINKALKKISMIDISTWGWFDVRSKENDIFSHFKKISTNIRSIPRLDQGIFFNKRLYFSVGGIGAFGAQPFKEISKRFYSRIDPQNPLPPLIIRTKNLELFK